MAQEDVCIEVQQFSAAQVQVFVFNLVSIWSAEPDKPKWTNFPST